MGELRTDVRELTPVDGTLPWRVTSRTSVMGYRGSREKIPQTAKELGGDAILEGSVIRNGARVKIMAQLIDGRIDRHLWADTYERELEIVLAIQNDVARAVAREGSARACNV
jgi:TolB-like protein